jgi:hypothetical protein
MRLTDLAWFLLLRSGMIPPAAPDALASRFLEPLAHPWAAVAGGVLSGGVLGPDVAAAALRVAWRLLRLLLAL